MAGWQKHLPDYELIEWNEENFNININRFVSQAYKDKNYAFVSDYARAWALYRQGGVYLDTDVEVIKNFDKFLENDFFAGFEYGDFVGSCLIGSIAGHKLLRQYLDYYDERPYFLPDGKKYTDTSVLLLSELTARYGFKMNGKTQNIKGASLYSKSYFSPYNYVDATYEIKEETHSIHHFSQSWLPLNVRLKTQAKRLAVRLLGKNFVKRVRALVCVK